MPSALSFPMNMSLYDWGFSSEPEPHLGGRVLVTPRGKVLGGSSSINGMVYVRGHAGDFDHWAEQGAAGWGYADVLPYFKRMENCGAARTAGAARTGRCSSSAASATIRSIRPSSRRARRPASRLTDDYNGSKQEGFGAMEQTIHRGRRWSVANAYLRPALKRQKYPPGQRLRPESHHRESTRRRRRDRSARTGSSGAGKTRGDRRRLVDQLAEAADAVRHRPGRPSEPNGIEVIADRPGVGQTCRTIWSSISSRSPRSRSRSIPAEPVFQGADRRGVAVLQDRARRDQPFRGGRLRPLEGRRRLSRHPVPFPARRRALRRQGGGEVPRLPGACRAYAVEVARQRHAALSPIPGKNRTSASTTCRIPTTGPNSAIASG